jgi:hypothetical protein
MRRITTLRRRDDSVGFDEEARRESWAKELLSNPMEISRGQPLNGGQGVTVGTRHVGGLAGSK